MKAIRHLNWNIQNILFAVAAAAVFVLTILSNSVGTPAQLAQASSTLPLHIIAAVVLTVSIFAVEGWANHFVSDKK